MIATEFYRLREDGKILNRTYSTDGFMIRKIGTDEVYSEAIDIEGSAFFYEETDQLIDNNSL